MDVQHDVDRAERKLTRILVVEDEPEIAGFIRRGLIYKGYDVDVAPSGEEALGAAQQRPPDLVILDLMLPDADGIDVCRKLRAADDTPIIMLTARDTTDQKVAGLDAGADDYITKPFVFDELLARVRAALRRRSRPAEETLKIGSLIIRPASREVQRGERKVELTAREFDLLEFLARNAGRVMTHDVIFEKVWGYDWAVESDAIKVYVRYLRRKLNSEDEPDIIHAVRGIGYVLKE